MRWIISAAAISSHKYSYVEAWHQAKRARSTPGSQWTFSTHKAQPPPLLQRHGSARWIYSHLQRLLMHLACSNRTQSSAASEVVASYTATHQTVRHEHNRLAPPRLSWSTLCWTKACTKLFKVYESGCWSSDLHRFDSKRRTAVSIHP